MLRKIALSSMKGRKKDTFILSLVIVLSFIFIVITTILHASLERTKFDQKTSMFGKWDLSNFDSDEETYKRFQELDDVKKIGVSRIIGNSATCGNVGTFNQDMLDLGCFRLHEGKMPQKNDEIALELNQLKQFLEDVKVGDTIPVRIEIQVVNIGKENALSLQLNRVMSEIEEKAEELKLFNEERINQFCKKYYTEYQRNTQSVDVFDGTEIAVKTNYLYGFINFDLDGSDEQEEHLRTRFEKVETDGSIIMQKAYIKRDMRVTGIFETYSNNWDKGYNSIANAFIIEDTGETLIERGYHLTKELDATTYKTRKHLFIDTKLEANEFFDKYSDEFKKLKINTFLYSEEEDTTESLLTLGILLAVFIATMFTVFLIYFTQMRRRARRIALQKSIGATNGQIGKLFFWELFYLLIRTIPIGLIGGIGIGKIILLIVNKYGKTELNFHIDYRLTMLGVLAGVIAIFLSMLVPIIISMRIPLTGNISELPKRKKNLFKRKKEEIKSKKSNSQNETKKINRKIKKVNLDMKIQTFGKISIKNIKYNKGKYLLTLGLYTLNITVLLGCIFLSFLFFEDYINDVIITGKPSYGFEVNYGMIKSEIEEFTDEIYSIKGVKNIYTYKSGEQASLWYEGIEGNILQKKFKDVLPDNLIKDYFGIYNTFYVNLDQDTNHLVKESLIANVYGIDEETDFFTKIKNSITKGVIDKEKFAEGEEVILMIPMNSKLKGYDIRTDLDKEKIIINGLKNKRKSFKTRNQNSEFVDGMKEVIVNSEKKNMMKKLLKYADICDISYDFRNSKYYFHDYSIKIGEKIYLTIPTEDHDGLVKKHDVRFNDLKVAALIYYFPEEGIWPFADTIENPVILGSYDLIEKLYPVTKISKKRMDQEVLRARIATLNPTKFGKTWIYVETNNKLLKKTSGATLEKRAKERGFKLHDYKEGNDRLFRKAFNITLTIIILGIAVAIITSIILYNTSLSKLEQERDRIGTFQALGVIKEQFKRQYLITGICYGIISLLIAHMVLIIGLMFTSIGNSRPMAMSSKQYFSYIIQDQLWSYPWIIHIIVSILFFLVAILTYYLPLKKILESQPIDNIRSLGR